MTARTNAGPRVLAVLDAQRLTQGEIQARTGMSQLAVKSTLNALLRRGEVVRSKNVHGHYVYTCAQQIQGAA